MRSFSSCLETSIAYDEMCKTYTKTDGIIMLIFVALHMILTTVTVFVMLYFNTIFFGVVLSLVSMLTVIIILWGRKQTLATIGFAKKDGLKSFLIGLCFGILIFIFRGREQLFELENIGGLPALLWLFVYYLIIVSLFEELFFRGYVQTRMNALIKKNTDAVFFAGSLFSVYHLPLHLLSGYSFFSFFIFRFWILIIMHVIFNRLYKQYNSLAGPVLFHTLMNLSEVVWQQ